jgi:hypothetical protein
MYPMANAPNWITADEGMVKEACRQGEAQLAAQVQLATSADQRATVLAGIYVAAATGVIAAIATGDFFKTHHSYVVGAALGALAFLCAAIACIKATLPTDFWTPGNLPSEWYADIEGKKELKVAIGEQAAHFDDHIRENNLVITRTARYFLFGALLGIFAPVIGLVAAGLICLWG